jgi:hypothetical protein
MQKKAVHHICLFFVVAFAASGFSQETGRDYFISANAHYGFVIAHHGSMKYLVNGHTGGSELAVTFPTHGEKPWREPGITRSMGSVFITSTFLTPVRSGADLPFTRSSTCGLSGVSDSTSK